MSSDKDILRADQSALLSALERAGADVTKPKSMRCPFHDDTHPSAGVYQRDDGAWAFKCLGCGLNLDVVDVLARLDNKTPADILRDMKETKPPKREPEKPTYPDIETMEKNLRHRTQTYTYTDPDTRRIDLVVFRLEPPTGRKEFLQASPVGGGYSFGKPKGLSPLYNRARVRKASEVLVVEGEKCVHAAHDAGIVATTSPGGAQNAKGADWSPLKGKTVYIWPDNDANGKKYADDVESVLLTLGCDIRRINPVELGLNEKEDIADYLEREGGGYDDKNVAVRLVLGEARKVGAASGLHTLLVDTIEGRRRLVRWPSFRILSDEARSLLPGAMTVLCGGGGSSKSLMISQCLIAWDAEQTPFAVFHLEHDRDYHLRRVLAQAEGNSNLTVEEWIENNGETALAAFTKHERLLHRVGASMWDAPQKEMHLDALADWVRDRAKEKRRVLVIDPITAADSGKEPWLADKKFVLNAKTILREHGCSLVVVTHPRTGAARRASTLMDDMAGGAAYARFTDCVLWLDRMEEREEVQVKCDFGGYSTIEVDRKIQIRKARDGGGTGKDIGFIFDPKTLLFAEQGVIRKEKKHGRH